MELVFLTAELRDICEIRAVAVEKFGPVIAIELAGRLADIEAVDSMEELIGLYPDDVAAVGNTGYRLRLMSDAVLALGAGNVNAPQHENGTIDWSRVDRMLVRGIEVTSG